MAEVNKSDHTYIIYAQFKTSQFDQEKQEMRCKVLEAHNDYMLVESLKRYNRKYPNASRSTTGLYAGMPVRRVNKDQALVIIDEATGKWITWETVRRREGTNTSPGRDRGGR